MPEVSTAVITAAGQGTRLSPLTRAIQKEMLPVGDRPAVQHVAEECVRAGARRVIFIIGDHGDQLRRHFGRNGHEAGDALGDRAGTRDVVFEYLRQPEPLGLGHAVACARPAVGDTLFMLALGDAILRGSAREPLLGRMTAVCAGVAADGAVGLEQKEGEALRRCGVAAVRPAGALFRLTGLVEKPEPSAAPSPWVSVGRYVLGAGIMEVLASQQRGLGGEIQLTDALDRWIREGALVIGVPLSGDERRFDTGSVAGLHEAATAMLRAGEAE